MCTRLYLCLLSLLLSSWARAADEPNVLVIFTDDHRFSGVHSLAGGQVQTPNIDRLSEEGFVFTQAFLQGSMHPATCIPSRHMLLTGRSLFDLEGRGYTIPPSSTMMGEAFRDAGYRTYHVGKWHNDTQALARSADKGIMVKEGKPYLEDQFRMPIKDWDPSGVFSRDEAYLFVYDESGATVRRGVTDADERGPTGTEADGPHSSNLFADGAIELIGKHDPGKPFFMYLAFFAPHDPRQAPEAYRALYPAESIGLPPSYRPQHPFDNGEMSIRDEQLAPWPRTVEVVQQELADYYAIITHMDAQVGRVLEALEASGQADNTIIVFAGDSGLAVGNHGLMGKQSLYDEDGIHVPLIFGGKLEGHGTRLPAFAYTYDVFPTLCELAGIDIPKSVTGTSLAPILNGEVDAVRNFTYHAYKDWMRAYRRGDFKLIEYFRKTGDEEASRGSRVTQLFNLADDPWETTDLSFRREYQSQLRQMQTEMRETALELDDDIQF